MFSSPNTKAVGELLSHLIPERQVQRSDVKLCAHFITCYCGVGLYTQRTCNGVPRFVGWPAIAIPTTMSRIIRNPESSEGGHRVFLRNVRNHIVYTAQKSTVWSTEPLVGQPHTSHHYSILFYTHACYTESVPHQLVWFSANSIFVLYFLCSPSCVQSGKFQSPDTAIRCTLMSRVITWETRHVSVPDAVRRLQQSTC